MCVIGPDKGTFIMITKPPFLTDIVKDLDTFYVKYKKKIEKMDAKTETDIQNYIDQKVVQSKKQEVVPSPSPSASKSVPTTTSTSSSAAVSPSESKNEVSKEIKGGKHGHKK